LKCKESLVLALNRDNYLTFKHSKQFVRTIIQYMIEQQRLLIYCVYFIINYENAAGTCNQVVNS